jgi:hypothetical protein
MNYLNTRKPIGTTARTGETCPESGGVAGRFDAFHDGTDCEGQPHAALQRSGGYLEADPLRLNSAGSSGTPGRARRFIGGFDE